MAKPTLSEQDFQDAAAMLSCEVAAIKAVCTVESPRGGFNPDDSPVTLFEGHIFYKYTNGKFASSNPSLCYPKWTTKFYGKSWQEEQARLQSAIALDRRAALLSASWGRFQIMGFNFALVGFTDLQKFINAMYQSEAAQLAAFCEYVRHNGLADELQRRDWAGFARGFNGADYAKNDYAGKLERAYRKNAV